LAEVKWIKLNVDMFDDEKIKIIQAMPDGDSLLIVWIKLITLAGKTNDGGYIYISDNIPYTEEMLAVIMNKPLATIRLALQTFTNLNMLDNDTKGIYLINFDKHQSLDKLEKIKEQNRERKRLQRAKQKDTLSRDTSVTSHANVTQCHATDKEEDIEEDKEKEKDVAVATGDGGDFDNFELMGGTLGRGVILLTQKQQDELIDKLGFDAFNHYIGKLADFIIEKNAKVSNHYATIIKWAREDAKV
jgi:predicted phage replisome organizer